MQSRGLDLLLRLTWTFPGVPYQIFKTITLNIPINKLIFKAMTYNLVVIRVAATHI